MKFLCNRNFVILIRPVYPNFKIVPKLELKWLPSEIKIFAEEFVFKKFMAGECSQLMRLVGFVFTLFLENNCNIEEYPIYTEKYVFNVI